MTTDPPAPRRRRRRIAGTAGLLVVLLAVAAGVVWNSRRSTPKVTAGAPVAVQSAVIVRTDLSVTTSLTGALGYGQAQPVKGARDGIITWLPRSGTPIARGEQLYRVDDQPVPLFYGSLPLYRELARPGTVGRDVRVLAANLQALGYSIGRQPAAGSRVPMTTPSPAPSPVPSPAASPTPQPVTTWTEVHKGDGVLTRSLIAALRRWQRDLRLPVTGRIGIGDVVVLAAAVRVDSLTAQRGDAAAAPLLTVTPTAKVITAKAGTAVAAAIEQGDPVTVVLPGDTSVPGKVTAIATTVEEEGSSGTPQRAITVTVTGNRGLSGLDAAAVQVDLAGETHRDVLAVPVGALVALSEGGYAVQLAEGNRLVAVETGMFAIAARMPRRVEMLDGRLVADSGPVMTR
ncbi:HlyD family efflux transporter periplasmic adaptor subunit [Actinoplanes sp. TFC3]|uniref:HlyD family efflux transporter periplasmic adaptor subunit n=1 Tax=Actinoplanes sp. TFC3 TaxID=1710355 RepID=UPI000A918480|nr:HlyD family efflux transporter periplasmic adaptor subunit [Actinoplanes sp. TFC3]